MSTASKSAQVEALLANRAFFHVWEHFQLERTRPVPWREAFDVTRAEVEAHLAAAGRRVEEYGGSYSLTLAAAEGGWVLRFFEYDDRSGPREWTRLFATVGEARAGMIDEMLRHTLVCLEWSFGAGAGPDLRSSRRAWWRIWG